MCGIIYIYTSKIQTIDKKGGAVGDTIHDVRNRIDACHFLFYFSHFKKIMKIAGKNECTFHHRRQCCNLSIEYSILSVNFYSQFADEIIDKPMMIKTNLMYMFTLLYFLFSTFINIFFLIKKEIHIYFSQYIEIVIVIILSTQSILFVSVPSIYNWTMQRESIYILWWYSHRNVAHEESRLFNLAQLETICIISSVYCACNGKREQIYNFLIKKYIFITHYRCKKL